MSTRRLTVDRISSSTRNAHLAREVLVGEDIVSREGYVLAVKVLTDKSNYNQIEDVSGRMIPLRSGDVVVGTLGSRRALRGYAGVVPESIQVGDMIHVLNLGGVLGQCTSSNPDIGRPFEAEVLGAVLTFPRTGDRIGKPAHIRSGAIPTAETIESDIPMVLVAGTCMNSGKTVAASEIVRGLVRAGRRVAGLKLTGVSLRRDSLSMVDAGACYALTFNDAGIVSTDEKGVLPAARGLINHMARKAKPDVMVAELGDGILGEYGVQTLLADAEFMQHAAAIVMCAPDQVGAWGSVRLLRERWDLPVHVITGPVTDNEVGCSFVRSALELPAVNARRAGDELVEVILAELAQRDGVPTGGGAA